jgi:hypothetical protein
MPAYNKIQWPLCYIANILECFKIGQELNLNTLINGHLATFATKTESGLDWELIVLVAILLHCIDAKMNGSRGPFNIAGIDDHPDVINCTLGCEITTVERANQFIDSLLTRCEKSTLLVVTPSYSKFPDYDGIVCYKDVAKQRVLKMGYQVKLGRNLPVREVPDYFEAAHLIRGVAPEAPHTRGKWNYWSREDILGLMGYSLYHLVPSSWPVVPDVHDGFD